MAQLVTLQEVDEIAEEMADRFGDIPDEVDNLFYQLRLKVLAGRAGVESITIDGGKLAVRCARLESVNRVGLQRRFGRESGIRVSRRAVWVPYVGQPQSEWKVALVQVLEVLAEL
jgi:transcription-repair coupling factor (superfamily II helicase)